MYRHRSLAALMIYYIITVVHNMMVQDILPVGDSFQKLFGVINNYLDVPLMLTALYFFCAVKKNQKVINALTIIFVTYEVIIAVSMGLTTRSVVYIMGIGLPLILIYSFILFVRQIKFTIVHGKNAGRTIMLASILFAYGGYILVYYFFYVTKTKFVQDAFLLYFIASFISSVSMAMGLLMTRKRLKELQDTLHTRKELALFFNN